MSFLGITPSALPRLAKCLGGAALPHDTAVTTGKGRGLSIHEYLERLAAGATPEASLAEVPQEWREDCAAVPLDRLPPLTSGLAEVAMAWSPATGRCRILGPRLSREAARERCEPGEMPMVADWVSELSPGQAVLVDWKTASELVWAPVEEHLQLLTYGSVYLLATGVDEVQLYLCRPDSERPGWNGPAVLDRLAAEEHLERVRALVEQAQAAREAFLARHVLPDLHLGPWCTWCSARFRCPGQVGALVAVANGDAEQCVRHVMELTPQQAGALYWQVKAARKLAESLTKQLESFARDLRIPLPDGKVLAEVPETEEVMEPAAAAEWLERRFGEQVAAAAIQAEGNWTRLKESLATHVLPELKQAHKDGRLQGRPPTLAGLVREARDGLRAAGAVKRVTHMVVRPVQSGRVEEAQTSAPALPDEDAT